MNNLEKAKELENKFKYVLENIRQAKVEYEAGINPYHEVEYYQEIKMKLIKEAKELKEEIEKGCKKRFDSFNGLYCGGHNRLMKGKLCPDCEESIKILDDLLGETEQ